MTAERAYKEVWPPHGGVAWPQGEGPIVRTLRGDCAGAALGCGRARCRGSSAVVYAVVDSYPAHEAIAVVGILIVAGTIWPYVVASAARCSNRMNT